MPMYDCGDPDCHECQKAYGPDRSVAIAKHTARESQMDRLYAAELARVHATADRLDAGRNIHVAEPFRALLNAATPNVPPVPMWRGTKIRTAFIYPPIPTRKFDWQAVTDNYDGADDSRDPIGYGSTEAEAVSDLIEQLEDAAE